MAHLISYKSFNLPEIEEIEGRIFGAAIISSENELRGCQAVTNIPNTLYNKSLGALFTPPSHDDASWQQIQVL